MTSSSPKKPPTTVPDGGVPDGGTPDGAAPERGPPAGRALGGRTSKGRTFRASFLGRVPYGEALALQERLADARIRGEIDDTLLLLEHPPVITLGRGAKEENVHIPRAEWGADGTAATGGGATGAGSIEVVATGRGGDVTFHGPGQLVAYPIFDLKPDRCDVRRYVADLARVMIGLAADHGVCAASLDAGSKYVGVWVDADAPHAAFDLDEQSLRGRNIRKIGAIGVRISRWVTLHGFAFNGTVNLSHYDLITPCGIREYGVTSLKALGVTSIPEGTSGVEMLAHRAIVHIARVFDAEATYVDPKELWSAAGLEPPPTNT